MDNLLAARGQMAMSLAFHIIFSAIGIGLPLLMVIAEALWLRTGQEVYLTLARLWSRGAGVLFAVGAVSGTVLSFELGLLWPGFMRFAGGIIGMPFSLEGFAFFTEGIFLGIYLYGWDRVPRRAHFISGLIVALSGAVSGLFVVTANAWMNHPTGFQIVNGQPVNVDPIAAMFNPGWFSEALHMTLAAYLATAAAVAAIHAFALLRDRGNLFHRRALAIALAVMAPTALLQPISGDINARLAAATQPAKLAAFEGQFKTEKGAPLTILGIPDPNAAVTRYAIEIPYGLSILAFHDPNATVTGLLDFPRDQWPPTQIVHPAFDLMVGSGFAMLGVSLLALFLAWRKRRLPDSKLLLWAIVACGPLGFLAIEAGWVVTEVGRQPWIIYNVLRTADAVTPVPGLVVPFVTFTALYFVLAALVIWILWRQVAESPRNPAPAVPPSPETGHAAA
jgi:cytochrome bd ubiquinol oxidase subunit I